MTGDDIAARALSVYGKGWIYEFGAKPRPSVPPGAAGVRADCTGFAWWGAGKAQVGRIQPGQGANSWLPLQGPQVGCAVWHAADPGKTSGHVGLVIKVYTNGDFDSLDCSSTPAGPRGGAIRLLRNARAFWSRSSLALWGFDWPVWATAARPGGGGGAARPGGGGRAGLAVGLAAAAVAVGLALRSRRGRGRRLVQIGKQGKFGGLA